MIQSLCQTSVSHRELDFPILIDYRFWKFVNQFIIAQVLITINRWIGFFCTPLCRHTAYHICPWRCVTVMTEVSSVLLVKCFILCLYSGDHSMCSPVPARCHLQSSQHLHLSRGHRWATLWETVSFSQKHTDNRQTKENCYCRWERKRPKKGGMQNWGPSIQHGKHLHITSIY